jgi:hypothetical protein
MGVGGLVLVVLGMAAMVVMLLTGCTGDLRGVVAQSLCTCEVDAAPPPDAAPHDFVKLHALTDSVFTVGASSTAARACDLMQATYPGAFVYQCIGGRSLNFYAYDAARRASVVSTIASGAPTEVYIALGYNDRTLWAAELFRDAYADFLGRLRAALPGARLYAQTIIARGGGATGTDAYSQAIRDAVALANAAGGQVVLVEAWDFGIIKPADYYDAVHLVDTGHAKEAAGARAAVGW